MAIEYFWQDETGMLDEVPALPRDEQLQVRQTDKSPGPDPTHAQILSYRCGLALDNTNAHTAYGNMSCKKPKTPIFFPAFKLAFILEQESRPFFPLSSQTSDSGARAVGKATFHLAANDREPKDNNTWLRGTASTTRE